MVTGFRRFLLVVLFLIGSVFCFHSAARSQTNWWPVDIAVGSDNKTRLFWTRSDGTAGIWTVDNNGVTSNFTNFGPYAGWYASDIATGSDGYSRLLWNNSNGIAGLWLLNANNSYNNGFAFGPYSGSTAIDVTVGSDDSTRLLWTDVIGEAEIWSVGNSGNYTNAISTGSYTGWTAMKIAAGGDGLSRLLWSDTDGAQGIWLLNANNSQSSSFSFGPYTGWTAVDVAVGSDNRARLLWTKADGTVGVWTVDNNGVASNLTSFGPYPGWTVSRIATGSDGYTRLLWNKTDGTAGLWLLNSNNSYVNGFHFGPYTQTPNTPVYGLDFGPYTGVGQDPNLGSTVPAAQITSLLLGVKGYTHWIRTFGTQNGLENVPAIAKKMGFKTAIGAYIGTDTTVNNAQIANLIAAANAGNVDIAIVGDEVLLDNLQTESQLITYIQEVKAHVPPGVLVTTVDTWNTMVAHPNVIAAVDVVAVNIYPFYENVAIGQALSDLQSDYASTLQAANGKTVIITETGWPSSGSPPSTGSAAVPSSANAATYFSSVETWIRNADIPLFYMEAYDEAWKANYNDYPSWGIWDSSGNLKPGMASVFQ